MAKLGEGFALSPNLKLEEGPKRLVPIKHREQIKEAMPYLDDIAQRGHAVVFSV